MQGLFSAFAIPAFCLWGKRNDCRRESTETWPALSRAPLLWNNCPSLRFAVLLPIPRYEGWTLEFGEMTEKKSATHKLHQLASCSLIHLTLESLNIPCSVCKSHTKRAVRTHKNSYEDTQKQYQAPQRLEKPGKNETGQYSTITYEPAAEIAVRCTPYSVVTSRNRKRRRKDRQRRRNVHTSTHKPFQTITFNQEVRQLLAGFQR